MGMQEMRNERRGDEGMRDEGNEAEKSSKILEYKILMWGKNPFSAAAQASHDVL